MSDDAQALESLLSHPGWRLFFAHVQREWGKDGAKFHAELEKALDLTDNDAAASQARQIKSAQRTIELLLCWPGEELGRLKRADRYQESEMVWSRRGSL